MVFNIHNTAKGNSAVDLLLLETRENTHVVHAVSQ